MGESNLVPTAVDSFAGSGLPNIAEKKLVEAQGWGTCHICTMVPLLPCWVGCPPPHWPQQLSKGDAATSCSLHTSPWPLCKH